MAVSRNNLGNQADSLSKKIKKMEEQLKCCPNDWQLRIELYLKQRELILVTNELDRVIMQEKIEFRKVMGDEAADEENAKNEQAK